MAQERGAQHVKPAQSACNPEPCLIHMFHGGFFAGQQVLNSFGKRVHLLGLPGDQTGQRCRCDLDAEYILNNPRQAPIGNTVLYLQIGGQSPNFIAVLSGGSYTFREGGSGLCTAMMTLASVRTMFGDNKWWRRRKVKNLPGCRSYRLIW